MERQAKTSERNPVVAIAPVRAQARPLLRRKPQAIESAPNVPPEMSAVAAFSGFDRKPTTPTATRNAP